MKALRTAYEKGKLLPFSWGKDDCLTWVADCAQAITGTDPAKDLRGTYDSEIMSRRVMVQNGWKGMGDVAAAMYGEIPVSLARSGDWALIINSDDTETLGVVVKHMICARTRELGLGQVPLQRAARAFRVK